MKKFSALFLSLLLLIGLLVGCGQTNNAEQKENNSNASEQSKLFPVTVKDALGEDVTIKEKPKRIVSLIPSNTEIAYALGLGEQIVGVSDNDNYPEDVQNKEKVGGMEFNVEKIISLKPDLVLAHASSAHNSQEGLKQLKDAGINVFVVEDAQSFDKVYDSIQTIGKITGTSDKAEDIVAEMKTKLADIQEKGKTIPDDQKVSVFVEVNPAPQIYTTGKGTFMDEMLTIIGAKNAAGDQEGWPQMTEEAVVKLNPDVIVTTYGYYVDKAVDQVLARKGWENVSAVKNKRVYDVHSDLVSRPGPRLVEGVEELAKAIYPDVYKK
ncbi:ABC transporter substrate-binding protein [Aeribacillus pallidus]|uniref:ABC transporter substrate-binding protein n=1 Tax=Aeribacillus pallidus TaxID=33936 RepID=A0A223E6C4_9BACI|nr:ABC transporter substrate-binding protein [Aeribacillus pallidus]ASS90750.1 ABC transporter substrate-binding protein [Aeribacillus pallidus]